MPKEYVMLRREVREKRRLWKDFIKNTPNPKRINDKYETPHTSGPIIVVIAPLIIHAAITITMC